MKTKLYIIAGLLLFAGLVPLGAHSKVSALSGAYPASDVLGQTNFTDNTTGTTADTFGSNWGSTAIDTVHHRLYVSDPYNYRVLIYYLDSHNNLVSHSADKVLGQADLNTGNSSGVANVFMSYPTGLAADPVNNRLFVASENGVFVFNFDGGITDGMAASNILGQAHFGDSDCTVDRATICSIFGGLAFDAANERLFVMDEEDSRVMVFNVSPSHIANGENADHVLGQTDFTSDNTDTTQNTFESLEYAGMVYNDVTKQLFVSDSGNNRVMIFNLANGITNGMNASHVLGQTDFVSSNDDHTRNTFSSNMGLGIDEQSDQLFVDDMSDNCRVLIFNLADGITNGMNASGVLGQSNFTDNSCSESQTGFGGIAYANNMAYDPTQSRLYVPNYTDSRVLIYNFVHLTSSTSTNTDGTLPKMTLKISNNGSFYSQSLAPARYQGTLTFALTGGALPPGLTLNTHTGVISGTPTKPGVYHFEVTVTDDLGAAGKFVLDPPYTIVVDGPSVGAPDTGYGAPIPTNELLILGVAAVATFSAAFIVRFRFNKISR